MEPSGLDDDVYFAQLERDADLLLAAAVRAGWDAPVPGLDWDVRRVVTHLGAVHRWSSDIVARALPTNETGGSAAFEPADLGDADRPDWLRSGLRALLDTLRTAPPDLSAFTLVRGRPARPFWIRRQAHETAIHRVDVEAAAGGGTAFDAGFAQDGIAEIVLEFGRGKAYAVGRPATLALHAVDGPSWSITFGGERNVAQCTGEPASADATVRATSSELYRWAWNRPGAVEIDGDASVPPLWRAVRI